MAFEVYTPRKRNGARSARKAQPFLKVSGSAIVLSKAARQLLDLADGADVELAFDPEEKLIRITPGGAIKLRKTKLFAKGFLGRFGIAGKGALPVEVKDGALYAKVM